MEHLSKEDFFHVLHKYEGLIPVSIDVMHNKLMWLDMEKYHFYEGFFHKSLDIFSALKKGKTLAFSTDLDILKDDAVVTDCIYPSGFIFHAGRCGSTLLAKTLARSQENLVLSEAGPHNSIWYMLTKNAERPLQINDENKTIYRNLLLAMARRRGIRYERLLIKFTSFNIHFFDFIHAVFPDVPAIFLRRDIAEILTSWEKRLPGWFITDKPGLLQMLTGSNEPDLKKIIESFMKTASKQSSDALKQIDYQMIKPDNLALILGHLNIETGNRQIDLMKSQFSFDSKIEFNKSIFKHK